MLCLSVFVYGLMFYVVLHKNVQFCGFCTFLPLYLIPVLQYEQDAYCNGRFFSYLCYRIITITLQEKFSKDEL